MPGSRMSISTHVRVKLGDQFEGELTGAGLTNALQVGVRVENLTGAIPVQRVVVDDHNHWAGFRPDLIAALVQSRTVDG